jgi:hypothetical protein
LQQRSSSRRQQGPTGEDNGDEGEGDSEDEGDKGNSEGEDDGDGATSRVRVRATARATTMMRETRVCSLFFGPFLFYIIFLFSSTR